MRLSHDDCKIEKMLGFGWQRIFQRLWRRIGGGGGGRKVENHVEAVRVCLGAIDNERICGKALRNTLIFFELKLRCSLDSGSGDNFRKTNFW